MHLYWRISEELKELGEILIFRDPGLRREYARWLRRNGMLPGRADRCPLGAGRTVPCPEDLIRLTGRN